MSKANLRRTAILFTLVAALPAQEVVRSVPPGREVRDTKLLTLGKTDRWDLEVAAGEVLWCKVDSSVFDPVLELVDAGGEILGQNDGEGTRSEIFLRVPSAGAVAFRVRGYEGSGGGTYNFWMQRYRTEEIRPGGTSDHRFGRERWWHYLVPVRAGQILVPSASGSGGIRAVFDGEQRVVKPVLGGYPASRDGVFYIRVEGPEDRTCHFRCALARQRDLPEQLTASETLAPFGQDVWRLRLRAGAAYCLAVQMPGAQLEYQLREPDPGRTPAFVWTGTVDKGGSRRRWLVARRDCALELLLHNRHPVPSDYGVGLPIESPELHEGAPVSGDLEVGGGVVYELPSEPGQLLRVTLESTAFDGQLDLWNPDGTLAARCDDAGPMVRNPELTFLVARPGCHRLLVTCPGGGGGGRFAVKVESLAVPELRVGQPLDVQVAAGATTYCHLGLRASQEIWLSLRSRDFDVAVTVLAPDGRRVGGWEGGGVDGDVLTAFRAPADGRYTLQVHSRSKGGRCTVRAVLP